MTLNPAEVLMLANLESRCHSSAPALRRRQSVESEEGVPIIPRARLNVKYSPTLR